MKVCLIEVPYTIGDERHGASKGAVRLVEAGAAERAAAVAVKRVERGIPFGDSVSSSAIVNEHLAAIVRRATAGGAVPLDNVYVHVDLDALDPEVAPGVVDAPVPGGLSLPDLEEVLHAVTARFQVRAAAVTTYNPDLDPDERTLRAALRIIGVLSRAT